MNIKEIEQLIERYYEGETTLAEETLLKEFFSGDDVPEYLRQHQPIFRYFADEVSRTLNNEEQEKVLLRRIGQFEKEVSGSGMQPVQKRMYYLSGIAAGLLILFGLVFTFKNELSKRNHAGLVNPSTEVAYTQTKQALLLVSVGLNTGFDAVQRLNTLNNAMGQIQKINKFYNYQNQFINPERMQDPSTNK
ncbi:MAG: hypothetical protein NTX43_06105 [Bacteroidetes bacterium]|nr:hypothetical protein [Bacteroidota bacterium]